VGLLMTNLHLFSQSGPSFKTIPEFVHNSDTVKVIYNAEKTVLKDKKNVSAVMYLYQNYKWSAQDIQLKGGSNKWYFDFLVPKDCGLMAFKFLAGASSDNNNNLGYFVMMRDKFRQGKMAQGAYAGWGLARSPKYGLDIQGYIKYQGITDSATYHWLNQEISFNQDAKSILAYPYAVALQKTFKDSAGPRMARVLSFLKRTDATENDLLIARKIVKQIMPDKNLLDSIDQVLMSRFPKGSLARLAAFKMLPQSQTSNIQAAYDASKKFINDFPQKDANQAFDLENRLNYEVIKQNIIVLGAHLQKNYADLDRYLTGLAFPTMMNIYYKIVDIPLKRKEVDYKTLLPVSEKIIKRAEYLRLNQPGAYNYLSPIEWHSFVDSVFAMQFTTDHIILLNHAGLYDQALRYADQTQPFLGYKNAVFNDQLSEILFNLKSTSRLKTVLEKSIYENQASPEMLEMIRKIYIKEKGSDMGFADYSLTLQNTAEREKSFQDLAKQKINVVMEDFTMQDPSGRTISLKDLKGKTVVFDFWATWCIPCKASFPGMKMAVEKYAKDPDVVFYFVDTQERGDTYKQEIAKYLKENNYPFNVLFDNKVPGDKATGELFSRVCKTFKISGIPQKIVMDKNGIARFISVGFNGSATALADEISHMVDLTKNTEL